MVTTVRIYIEYTDIRLQHFRAANAFEENPAEADRDKDGFQD